MNTKVLLFLFLVSAVLMACSFGLKDTSKSASTANVNGCASNGKILEKDERVVAEIAKKDAALELVMKDSYTIDELKDLSYGATYKGTDEGYYSTYELCDTTTNTYIEEASLKKEDWNYHLNTTKEDYGAYAQSQTGQKTNFVYTSSGEEMMDIVSGNSYSLNVFIATEGGDWKWVASHEFKVE
jgi:hypothetical protein